MEKPKQTPILLQRECQECGVPTVFKSGNQKYCKKCSKLVNSRARKKQAEANKK